MNYEFPYIAHINDVLPAIEGRPEFVVAEKEGYTVINYNVAFEDTFPPVNEIIEDDGNPTASMGIAAANWDAVKAAIRRECRGIIFNTATGEIIRRPFHKFFNVNEREETQEHVINLSRPHAILEKLDGSMIAPFIVDGKMIWGTKMGATPVSEPVEQFILRNSQYETFARLAIAYGYTPIFEWCSRKQRIVLDYGREDQLILTAMRHIKGGSYLSFDDMESIYAIPNGMPIVRRFEPQKDMREFLEYVRDLEDLEGFVVRFEDGHMTKLKCHWYVQIHKAKEKILQDRNIVELILTEHLDDIKAHLPEEDRARLNAFEADFNRKIIRRAEILSEATDSERSHGDRKTFALGNSKNYNQFSKGTIFALWENNSVERALELVRNTIMSNLSRTPKYEEIRDLWFEGVKFND